MTMRYHLTFAEAQRFADMQNANRTNGDLGIYVPSRRKSGCWLVVYQNKREAA